MPITMAPSTCPTSAIDKKNRVLFLNEKQGTFQSIPVLFWRRGAAHREWMSLTHGMGNVVLHIFDWYCDVTTFWPLETFKTS